MSRLTLIRSRDGIYRIQAMRGEIDDHMRPKVVEPQRLVLTMKAAGYFAATVLVGLGVLLAMIVVTGFAVVFWTLGKVRRAWR
jgi:hypothetical protein